MLLKNTNSTASSQVKLKKPILPGILVLSILIIGTVGFYLLWFEMGVTWVEAAYMTVITMTTVGYRELYPLDNIGMAFTMFISVFGIGSLFYVLSVLMENLFIIQIQNIKSNKNTLKKVKKMNNHIIIVGMGRVGTLAIEELANANAQFVVIDDSHDSEDAHFRQYANYIINGDATEDDILLNAGILNAKGIIIATGNSATNVFVTLSAKVLNPNIFIVARADDNATITKLNKAGADRVVNPYSIGGQRLANLMINPNVVDFFETNLGSGQDNIKIENLSLDSNCTWFNKSLKDINIRQITGATIIAVIRNEQPIMNPGGEFILMPGDQLVAVGTRVQLSNLEKQAIK